MTLLPSHLMQYCNWFFSLFCLVCPVLIHCNCMQMSDEYMTQNCSFCVAQKKDKFEIKSFNPCAPIFGVTG